MNKNILKAVLVILVVIAIVGVLSRNEMTRRDEMDDSMILDRLNDLESGYQKYITQRKANMDLHYGKNHIYFPWWYLRPAFACPYTVQRIGEWKDGGKWVCGMEVYENTRDPCIVYSFGASYTSGFELEFLKRTNCSVYAYDIALTEHQPDNINPRAQYSRMALADHDRGVKGVKSMTLGQLMKENGHSSMDILKMDIEKYEYPVLKQVMDEFETLPFSQLQLEVHLGAAGKPHLEHLIDLWERLEGKGMRAFSGEINPFTITHKDKTPDCYEYSFINIFKASKLVPVPLSQSSS